MSGLGLFLDYPTRDNGRDSDGGDVGADFSRPVLSNTTSSQRDIESNNGAQEQGRISPPPSMLPPPRPASTIPTLPPLPALPALPAFPSDTAYSPLAQEVDTNDNSRPPHILSRSATVLKSTNRRLVGTIRRSIRSPMHAISQASKTPNDRYEALDDEDEEAEAPLKQNDAQHSVKEVDDTIDDEPLNFDLTSFTGPSIALKTINSEQLAEEESQRNGTISEFNRLESQGKLTGGLGKGMDHLATLQMAYDSPAGFSGPAEAKDPITVDGKISRYKTIREVGQREADQRGEMIVVKDSGPVVDLSSLAGGDSSEENNARKSPVSVYEGKDSYYIPPDPNMPNWRPFSMRKPYIIMLILVSLLLGGVQEFLYRRSAQMAEHDGGLIEFRSAQQISISNYFAWKYMPTMVLVTYGVLWQIVDYEVKRLEPYYQLSRPNGALAAHSLNLDYLTYWSILAPVKACWYKQWAVVSSSVATLLAGGVVPTLQSASVKLYPDAKNRRVNELKFVRINPVWSRILTASLVVVGILGCILMVQLRRRSGLLSDPKGIAGIAAMAQKSHILMDFRGLDTARPDVIHQKIRHRRYVLYKSSFWQGEYVRHSADIQPGNSENRFYSQMLWLLARTGLMRSADESERVRHDNPHPPMLRLIVGLGFVSFMILVLILIPVFTFTRANIVTENAPWLFTGVAVIIKLLWGTLECDVRMIEPFYILSRRNAPPETLTLDYTGTIPGYISFLALINRHLVVFLVGMGAIATEILTVCVSSFAVKGSDFIPTHDITSSNNQTTTSSPTSLSTDPAGNHPAFGLFARAVNSNVPPPSNATQQLGGDQTVRSFWVSFILAELILIFLCLVATLVYLRRRHAFLPRQPNTIASVLAFIHSSKMLWDFIDTERMDSRTMEQHLTARGKTYGLGVFRGRDDEDHCGVDEEPLIGTYRHGDMYYSARHNRIENWDQY